VREAIHRMQRERWPPSPPISPEGRIAGLTTTGCVIASAVVWLVVWVRIALCTQRCTVEPGLAGLIGMLVAVALVAAVAMARAILARPSDPDAGSAWVFGLSVIFAAGVVAAASTIPSLACPAGTKLSFFGFCAGENGARLPAASWTWLRRLIDVAGVVVGFTVVRSTRWVKIGAVVAGAAWLAGTGALLLKLARP
jgi:hypothetical protein